MKITVTSYKKIDKGNLKGFATILFDDIGLTIDGMKVMNSKENKIFYSFPSYKYTDRDGNDKYKDHCGFYTKEGHAEYRTAITAAFKEYFAQNPQGGQTAPQRTSQQPDKSHYSQQAPPQAKPAYGAADDDLPF